MKGIKTKTWKSIVAFVVAFTMIVSFPSAVFAEAASEDNQNVDQATTQILSDDQSQENNDGKEINNDADKANNQEASAVAKKKVAATKSASSSSVKASTKASSTKNEAFNYYGVQDGNKLHPIENTENVDIGWNAKFFEDYAKKIDGYTYSHTEIGSKNNELGGAEAVAVRYVYSYYDGYHLEYKNTSGQWIDFGRHDMIKLIYNKAQTTVKYNVERYYQEDGRYSTKPEEKVTERTGTVGTNVSVTADDKTPNPKYGNYTYDSGNKKNVSTATLTKDGATLKIYFKEQFTVKFFDYDNTQIGTTRTYDYNETLVKPNNPTRAADNEFTYEFDGWTPNIATKVKEDANYKATYDKTYIDYKVTFKYSQNVGGRTIDSRNYHWQDALTTPNVPQTKIGNDGKVYTFVGWDKTPPAKVEGNATYVANYEKKTDATITVKYVDEKGNKIAESDSKTLGSQAVNPSTYAKNISGYEYNSASVGWSLFDVVVTQVRVENGNLQFKGMLGWTEANDNVVTLHYAKAQYDATFYIKLDGKEMAEPSQYEPKLFTDGIEVKDALKENKEINNDDAAVLANLKNQPSPSDIEKVTKAANVKYDKDKDTVKWYVIKTSSGIKHVDGVIVYGEPTTALYNVEYYYQQDGAYSEIPTAQAVGRSAAIGTDVSVTGDDKTPDTVMGENYVYDSGNTKNISTATLTKDGATLKVYFKEQFNVKFFDYDKTQIGDTKTYDYGATLQVPSDPTRAADKEYTYTFDGWDKDLVDPVTGDATYTATYEKTAIDYTVIFKDSAEFDGKEISKKTDYHYGDTLAVPNDPATKELNGYTYTFKGWDKTPSAKVEGDATYTATYEKTAIDYTITYENEGTEYEKYTKKHVGDAIDVPATDPTKASAGGYDYTFKGWKLKSGTEGANGKVGTTNLVYVAEYTSTAIDYTITYMNEGTEYEKYTEKHVGDAIDVPATNPTKASDGNYNYIFDKWELTEGTVGAEGTVGTTDLVYEATFAATPLSVYQLTINYVDENGRAIKSPYTDAMKDGAAYSVASPAIDGYTLKEGEKSVVEGNLTKDEEFTVVYTANDYTITYLNEDETQYDKYDKKHIGDVITAPATNPTKADDGNYHYAFDQWELVSGTEGTNGTVGTTDLVYKATYVSSAYAVYTLTINYVDENGDAVSPQYTEGIKEGGAYSVKSPVVKNYSLKDAKQATIAGTITEDTAIEVVYAKDTPATPDSDNNNDNNNNNKAIKTNTKTTGTKTGDDSNMSLWMFIALMGIAGAIAPIALRRKEKTNK